MPTNMPATTPSASPASGKVLIGLAGLAVGLLVGYGTGRVSTGTPVNPLSDKKGGYEEGYEAAMKKVTDSGLLPPAASESSTISGIVKTAADGRLTIEADTKPFDPLDLKSLPKERTVTITASTEITRLSALTPEEQAAAQIAFQEAMASFQPDSENPSPPPTPPSAFMETKISVMDLKAGDQVSVSAAADILAASSFEAVRVVVLPAPSAPPAPAAPPEEPPLPPEGGV